MDWLQQVSSSAISWTAAIYHDVCGGNYFLQLFYTAIMFDPKDVADNLKRQGAYVPGIRPGQQNVEVH